MLGGTYGGASATGMGIFPSSSRGFRKAGSVGGSRSDSIPVALVPGQGGYPGLRVRITQAPPYDPRRSMAKQRYRMVSHWPRYDLATALGVHPADLLRPGPRPRRWAGPGCNTQR